MLAELLFPGIAGVHIDTVRVETPTFHLYVSTTQPTSDCPVCHTPSAAIHSRYWGGDNGSCMVYPLQHRGGVPSS